MQNIIHEITKDQLRTDLPDFRAGDTVRVHVKVVEGSRERIQIFEGVVIKRQGGGISKHLPSVVLTALVLNVHSRFIHQKLQNLKLSVAVK